MLCLFVRLFDIKIVVNILIEVSEQCKEEEEVVVTEVNWNTPFNVYNNYNIQLANKFSRIGYIHIQAQTYMGISWNKSINVHTPIVCVRVGSTLSPLRLFTLANRIHSKWTMNIYEMFCVLIP